MNPRQQLQRPTSPRPQGSNKFFVPAGALAAGAGSGLLAPLLGFGGSIASTIFGNTGRKRREADARKWNLEQWHRQNQYNHPLQQMERLKAAGLNPNMIYGSSPGSAVGNAGAVHPGKAPEYKVENPVIPGFQSGQLQAQSNNLTANTLNTLELRGLNKVNREKAEATKADLIELTNVELQNKKSQLKEQLYNEAKVSQSWKMQVDKIEEELKSAKKRNNLLDIDIAIKKLDRKFAEQYELRPTDPFIYRALRNLWNHIAPHIPHDYDTQWD